ncbi:hypothetical protein U9M48_012656 [Paspalum notatum var. saurae]|uniref:Uncharacterized protein n=1 Tax=Paspalum notatum var. saurae TaxID=547442 RepID=A0AAQ3SXY2_PASNO
MFSFFVLAFHHQSMFPSCIDIASGCCVISESKVHSYDRVCRCPFVRPILSFPAEYIDMLKGILNTLIMEAPIIPANIVEPSFGTMSMCKVRILATVEVKLYANFDGSL